MRQRRKPRLNVADVDAMRDQEVLRATKELAAYFKGQRTEREARAALKIIKAYIRGREQLDPKNLPPLPGLRTPRTTLKPAAKKASKRRRKPAAPPSETIAATPAE